MEAGMRGSDQTLGSRCSLRGPGGAHSREASSACRSDRAEWNACSAIGWWWCKMPRG